MCRFSCKLKVELRKPCPECMTAWAEGMDDAQKANKLQREHIAHHKSLATDREYAEYLDQVAPVVTESLELEPA